MPVIEGITGLFPARRGRNAAGPVGLSELGEAALAQEAGARYTELVWNGLVYTIASALVATPAVGPLAAGGTPLLALYNPAGSGYIAVILRTAAIWTATGTVSGKAFELDAGNTAAITQATIQRGVANLVGAQPDNDMQGFTGVALTGSSVLSRLCWLSGVGNAVAQNTVGSGPEDFQGAIILQQGTVAAITAAVLGTADEAAASITYAKLKIT